MRPVGVALSVEAPHDSHVSVSPKVSAHRPVGVVGGVVSPVDDSRSVIARLSAPVNVSPVHETAADAAPMAEPVWNVPCEAVIERTTVREVPSQVGVKDAETCAV